MQLDWTLWNLSDLQAFVFIWQFWTLRIDDPRKHKVLYTRELYDDIIINL